MAVRPARRDRTHPFPGPDDNALWRFARLDPTDSLPRVGEAEKELPSRNEFSVHDTEPAGEPVGCCNRRPEIVGVCVVAFFDADDSGAVRRS